MYCPKTGTLFERCLVLLPPAKPHVIVDNNKSGTAEPRAPRKTGAEGGKQ
jgi:hypothetical protein